MQRQAGPDDTLRAILLRAFPGSRIEAWEALKGGVSAGATRVDLVLADASARRLVVRRPLAASRDEALHIASREYGLLSRCEALGIPAPRPCFLDAEAAALGLEYVEGAPDLSPGIPRDRIEQMASQLARIHRVSAARELGFLGRRSESAGRHVLEAPEALDASLGEAQVRAALRALWPWRQENEDVLLHGDYWPGNLLWREGRLAAVIDWEEAELGDPLADVALARLDLLWAFGEEAMLLFTECYRAQTRIDWRNLARWDLCVALRPMSRLDVWARAYAAPPLSRPDVTADGMREGHRLFVAQALRRLGMAPIRGPARFAS